MAQHSNQEQEITSTSTPTSTNTHNNNNNNNYNNYNYGYNYYQQGNAYDNMYYANNYTSTNTGYAINMNAYSNYNHAAYTPPYGNYNTNHNPPATEQGGTQEQSQNTIDHNSVNTLTNNTSNDTAGVNTNSVSDPSQAPHFWDDCEYINYVPDADSCSMCGEEVEDDELQIHLKSQHHVVFFACTTCRTVFSDLDTFQKHECQPVVVAPPPQPPTTAQQQGNSSQQGNKYDKKRKRGPDIKPAPAPAPAPAPPKIPEKVRPNTFGAVCVPVQKRARQKPIRGSTQIQDILQWQQNYNNPVVPPQQEETGSELVVRDEAEPGSIALTREMLLDAKHSADGLPVELDKMPISAIVCRTCSLLFASSFQLNKHAGLSKTHKKNVDIQRRQEQKAIRFDVTGDTSQKLGPLGDQDTYRDRSAERRAENPGGCPLDYQPKDTVTDYISADTPIEASNVGRKLLESMGWKEGKGLGKNEVGMVNPIIPQKMFRGAGLGTEVNEHEVAAAEASSYSDYLRNKKLARYAQLSKTIRDPVNPPS